MTITGYDDLSSSSEDTKMPIQSRLRFDLEKLRNPDVEAHSK